VVTRRRWTDASTWAVRGELAAQRSRLYVKGRKEDAHAGARRVSAGDTCAAVHITRTFAEFIDRVDLSHDELA
jgi:hypothetical protein